MITQENIPYTAGEIKAMVKTCEKYHKALERAKYALTTDMDNSGHWAVNYIFPELKESEDERIRKGIIELVKQSSEVLNKQNQKDMIAWLEKQSEVTKTSDQKLKPKFRVGDWITDGYGGGQITSIEDNYPCYKIANFMGGISSSIPFTVQDEFHLWTIQDAKDGDALATEDENFTIPFIAIYKSLGRDNLTFNSHFFIGFDGNFYEGEDGHTIEGIHPATKEQRDLLYSKMKQEGFEWNAEKKELKKIEQKPVDKVGPKFKAGDWV